MSKIGHNALETSFLALPEDERANPGFPAFKEFAPLLSYSCIPVLFTRNFLFGGGGGE